MPHITLLELDIDELAGQEPHAGREIEVNGCRYLIRDVKAPAEHSSKWRRRKTAKKQKWRLLVEQITDDNPERRTACHPN